MTRTPLLLALVATAALAGCNNNEPVVVGGPDDDPANQAPVTNGPVELPPSIVASHAYRCRDNSLVYIDFFTNNTAAIRTERGQPPVAMVTAEGGNPPYTGSGYSVSANADQISYTSPRGTLSCRTG